MTNKHNTRPTREEFFGYFLVQRRPEAADPESPFAQLALAIGAEAVVRTIDVIEGFTTPEPTDELLAFVGLHKLLSDEKVRDMWLANAL